MAQVLLTADDLASRKRFLNARHTFEALLARGVVPVVNENDTVAVEEIKVGDNDSLAALVATCVEADLVALLTDVEGLYDRDPRHPAAKLLSDVVRVTAEVERMAGGAGSERSVGGMATKVAAAKRLAAQGVGTALLSGRRPGALAALLAGEPVGTFFRPRPERRAGRREWLTLGRPGQGDHPGGRRGPEGPLRAGQEPAPVRGPRGGGQLRRSATRSTSRWPASPPSPAAWPGTAPTRCAGSRA